LHPYLQIISKMYYRYATYTEYSMLFIDLNTYSLPQLRKE